ncbi:MAG: gliding motility-associated C-terminal domain-containing protein, partial [Sphingobacteriales bacterium]
YEDDLDGNRRKVTVTYAPPKVFDRVQLRLGGGIANVLTSLNLFEAQKLMPRPVIRVNNVIANNVQACAGSTVTLTATAIPNTTFTWYTAVTGGSPIFTGASYTTGVLNAGTTLYVAAARSGCTDASERAPVIITINQIPVAPVITNANVTVCPGQPATFTAQTVAGISIRWYSAATGGTLLFTGNTFTTNAITANTSFYAEAVAGGTCTSTTRTQVTATVSPLPATPGLTDNDLTICAGEVAALSVAAPVNGIIYRWYTTATGGTPIFTGINFTSDALNSDKNFYVEAENATGCTSTQRAKATVNVDPKPANPTLAANDLSINAGQTASITISNAQTGITYNWYTSANAATPVHTGNNYTTPALYTNTTYHVAAVNAAGCQSANRTTVTISVTIDNNSPCTFANQQSSTINGLCIGCSITNRALAVDADTTTASSIHVIAGLLGGYAEQELRFQQGGFIGDTLRIVLQTPVGLADVNVLGRIEIALYNNNTQVVRYALDNALVKIRLLGGNNRYAVSVPATGNYDRVTIRLNSGIASLLSSVQVYYAIQQYPAPVFNPASPEICSGSTAQITANSPAEGLVYNWYIAPTGGTSQFEGATFTTPELTANKTYYVQVSRNGCAGSVRYPVQVLVNDPPAKPVVVPETATILSGQKATFTATAGNNVTIKWYEATTGGTAVFTGNTFTTPVLNADKTYYAESSIGNCVNPDRTPAPVSVTAVVIPNVAVNPPTQAVNPGTSATLTASSTTTGTIFNWYTAPTGGTSIFTGANYHTPSLFDEKTYYAEAVVQATGARSANRASGVVTVNDITSSPVACDAAIDQTTDINGLICLGCSVANEDGSIDDDRNTFSRLNVPVGLLNAYAQQTLRFANTGRAGDSVIVELGIPGTLANVNVLSQIAIATYNGNTYNNDRFNINSTLITIRLLDGTSRFRVTFKATASFDRVQIRLRSAVAGVFNSLNIYTASQSVTAPIIATATTTVCQGTQATLTATAPDHVTVRWYSSATGGTPLFTGKVFNTPVLNANTTFYAEASRTASNCPQSVRTPANVITTPIPAAPIVTAPTVTVCSGQPATFTAQAVTGVAFNWYTTPTGGTPVFTGASFTTPNLNETATYYVGASAGECGSSARTQVTANVTTRPLVPTVSQTPVETCSGSTAVLSATSTQAGVTFRWYTAATGGTPVFTGAQFTTPELTADRSYYVEAALNDCVSSTRAKADVDVKPTPAKPVVTVNPTGGQVTSGQTATLTATSGTAGATFRWYTAASGGTAIFTGASFTTPALTSTTTYYVEARIAGTGCVSTQRTAVTVTVNPIFSTDCDFASTQTTDVNGGLLCVGCAVSNADDAVDTDTSNFSRLNLPVAVLGSYVSQTLIFGDAGMAGDTVAIKIRVPASLASVSVLNRIQVASYNNNTYNGDRVNLASSLIRIQLLTGGQTAIVKFVPGAAFNRVEVRLNSVLAAVFNTLDIFYSSKQVETPQLTASTVNICEGSTATFTVSNARDGVEYNWYTAAIGGAPVFTGTSFTTDELTAITTYYVESQRAANDCPNPNRVAATANVTPAPDNPILSQNNVEICAGDNVTLTVTNANGAIVRWYNAATNGTLLFTGASYTVSPVSDATYYAELSTGDCASATRTVATVNVNPRPATPGVQSANVQVCTGSTATLRVLNPEAGVTYRWYTTSTGGAAVSDDAVFTTGIINSSTSYYVESASTATGCSNNGGRVRVNISINSLPGAPTLSATQSAVCSGGDITLSVTNPVAGSTYSWYTAATGGTPVFTGTTFNIDNITSDVSYYVEAENSNGCTSGTRTLTDITVTPIPPAPQVALAGGAAAVCAGNSATLNIVDPQQNLVYRWYSAATGGTLLSTGTTYTTPQLNTNRTVYVEATTTGNCNSSARTAFVINVTAIPATAVLVDDEVAVCTGSPATLAVSTPQQGVTYRWYNSPSLSTVLFTGTSYTTGPITANTIFYVTATNAAGCSSDGFASAQVTVQSAPSAPIIAGGNTQTTCQGATATLTIQDPQQDLTYRWYITANGITAVFTGPVFTTPALSGTVTYYAEAALTNGGCTSAGRTAVTVTVNPAPPVPQLASQGTAVCPGSTATLSATSTSGNVVNWYTSATGGAPVFTGNDFTTPAINANVTYYAEAAGENGGCVSATRAPVIVTLIQPLQAPVVTIGQTTAVSVSFTWTRVSGAESYEVSTDNGLGFTPVGNVLTYTISGLQASTPVSLIVRAVGNVSCRLSANSNTATGSSGTSNSIFIPNAFTPNGDGNNDIVYVYGSIINSLNFYIYDQWGELIFRSNNQGNGWDGTYKGKAMPVGVYVYYMDAVTNDGQKVNKKGTITLIR